MDETCRRLLGARRARVAGVARVKNGVECIRPMHKPLYMCMYFALYFSTRPIFVCMLTVNGTFRAAARFCSAYV